MNRLEADHHSAETESHWWYAEHTSEMAGAVVEKYNPARTIRTKIDASLYAFCSAIFGTVRVSHSKDF